VLHVPIAGRTPGAAGTLWQTDLVVSNLSHRGEALSAVVRYTESGSRLTREMPLSLAARETVVLRDVLQSGFGLETSVGSIRIEAAAGDYLGADARVYNVALSGAEYGQTVPALPFSALVFTPISSG
jgi:hypothetical protein